MSDEEKINELKKVKKRLQAENRILRIKRLRLRFIGLCKDVRICWLKFSCWILSIGTDKK